MDWPAIESMLLAASTLGREVRVGTKYDSVVLGVVEDEVAVIGNQVKHVLQRIRLSNRPPSGPDEYGYKLGTFVWSETSRSVKWAPHAEVMSEREIGELLSKARDRRWPLF